MPAAASWQHHPQLQAASDISRCAHVADNDILSQGTRQCIMYSHDTLFNSMWLVRTVAAILQDTFCADHADHCKSWIVLEGMNTKGSPMA